MSALARLFDAAGPAGGREPVRASSGAGAAREAGLDNRGATLTPPSRPDEAGGFLKTTSSRFELRHGIARMLRDPETGKGPSVCGCGRSGHEVEAVTLARRESGAVSVGGVFRCNSAWLCPSCAPSQTLDRQERVKNAVTALYGQDGTAVMVTLTVQHRAGDRLADLKRIVQTAGRKARQGAPWARIQKRAGVVGVLVAPEVTHGRHGWHFHLHLLVLCLAQSNSTAAEAGELLVRRYIQYVEAEGGSAQRLGQDVQVATSPENAAEYVAKGLAWELAGRSGKVSRSAKGRTPFEIAASGVAGDARDYALWREYAAAMAGTRSCVITKAMAERLGIEPAEDDAQDEGEQQLEAEGAEVGALPARTWNGLMRLGQAAALVRKVEADQPWPSIEAWARRVAHPPEPAPPPPPPVRPTARDVRSEAALLRGSTAARLGRAVEALRRSTGANRRFELDSTVVTELLKPR